MSVPALAVILLAALAGCATPVLRPTRQPVERVLVVPRAPGPANLAVAETAAGLVADTLNKQVGALDTRQFLRESELGGAAGWAPRLVERLHHGGWVTPEETALLRSLFGVSTLVAVEVTTYDQVWGKYAKFTRVGLELQAFDLGTATITVKANTDVEVEDKRGRAFQFAMEQAVGDLTATFVPPASASILDLWRSWRR